MKTSIFKSFYFQVLIATAIGILFGHYCPELGAQMKLLNDVFIGLIKTVIAPVTLYTIVIGIAGVEGMKAIGHTGMITLLYFEMVSTIALIVGLTIVNVIQSGVEMNVDSAMLDAKVVAVYAEQAKGQGVVSFLMGIIPVSVTGAPVGGNIL